MGVDQMFGSSIDKNGSSSSSSESSESINAGYTRDGFIQECAMRIFAESDFDRNDYKQLAKKAVDYATYLAKYLRLS